jgi:hypothetical protein
MKKLTWLVFLFIFINGCRGNLQPTQSISSETTPSMIISLEKPTNSPTVLVFKITATFKPTYTPTKIPTITKTVVPTPVGLMTNQEIKSRIDDWVSGRIEFSDIDKPLDEKTGEVVPLGVLSREFGDVIFLFYNLGFTVIYDSQGEPYLINVVGFEDKKGERFTFVFHNGKLMDSYPSFNLRYLKDEESIEKPKFRLIN